MLEEGRPSRIAHFAEGRERAGPRPAPGGRQSGSMNGDAEDHVRAHGRPADPGRPCPRRPGRARRLRQRVLGDRGAGPRDKAAVEEGLAEIEAFRLHRAPRRPRPGRPRHREPRRRTAGRGGDHGRHRHREPADARGGDRPLPGPRRAHLHGHGGSPIDDPGSDRVRGPRDGSPRRPRAAPCCSATPPCPEARLPGLGLRRPPRGGPQIALELKHQYRLGYDPPDGPRRFRRVEVRTTRKGVSVRTRSGYLPPS